MHALKASPFEYRMQSKYSLCSRQTNDISENEERKRNEGTNKKKQQQRIYIKRTHKRELHTNNRIFTETYAFSFRSICMQTHIFQAHTFVQSIEAWNFYFEYVWRIIMWCWVPNAKKSNRKESIWTNTTNFEEYLCIWQMHQIRNLMRTVRCIVHPKCVLFALFAFSLAVCHSDLSIVLFRSVEVLWKEVPIVRRDD